ncbi:MAG: GDP-mannose 4,6-dehydratase [Solirubrobacterales bacterium]|nr:GDP-mannose 4,6-dehydratase [Solirubrobacterales bacterium]
MSQRILITGASGFAGSHLADLCNSAGDEVFGLSRSGGRSTETVDLLDAQATRMTVAAVKPDVVYHLAALASVARSWADPGPTLSDNIAAAFNLFEAVRLEAPGAALVVVSSGELYGPPASLPVDETAPLRPPNPYAVSKASIDLLAGFYADAYDLRVIRARSFNHAGPRQTTVYAVASFAKQVADGLDAGDNPVHVTTGAPTVRRDFTDVRDVVRAYRLLSQLAQPGVYNVCSGRSTSAGEIVALLGDVCAVAIEHAVDSDRIRPNEIADVRGSHARLTAATGWEPQITLEQTLADTVSWWRSQNAQAGSKPLK